MFCLLLRQKRNHYYFLLILIMAQGITALYLFTVSSRKRLCKKVKEKKKVII